MKKTLSVLTVLAICAITFTASAQRFGTGLANQDNTGRQLTYGSLAPAYSATITIAPRMYETIIKPATLTGAMTVNANEGGAKKYDRLVFIFTSDGTGRVVTFGTNFIVYGTLTLIASKQGTVTFIYDGTNYVELSRTIQQ